MKEDDDDRPKKKITHEIGQDLYLLSVKELEERIALLTEEIERLKTSIKSKQSSRGVGLSLVNYADELPFFCDEVLPRLERLGVRQKR